MIAQIEGKLVALEATSALVQVGPVAYEVMLPSYTIAALAGKIGSPITLSTLEYYEGTLGGGNLIPRMIGFLNNTEKEFFARFTTVKGMGIKKGLKALCMPIGEIASAIEQGDEKILRTLPSVGKRMSQLLVAELQGKLQDFATQAAPTATAVSQEVYSAFQAEALEILSAWGEKRIEAMELIERASERAPDIDTAEELVPLVYRIKQGIEV